MKSEEGFTVLGVTLVSIAVFALWIRLRPRMSQETVVIGVRG